MATPPTFRAAATNRGNSTSATLTLPGTLVAGDIGILVLESNFANGVPTVDPTGWTVVQAATNNNGKSYTTIYKRVYAGGDGNPTITFGSTGNWSVAAEWYSGSAGVAVVGTFTMSTSGTTSTCAAVTSTSNDNTILSIGTHYFGGSGFASSATVAPDATISTGYYGTATFNHSIVFARHTKTTAGATNAQTITWNSTTTATSGIQLALIPSLPPQVWTPTSDTGATTTGWTKTPSGAASFAAVLADSDSATYAESGDNPSSLVFQTQTFSVNVPADLNSVVVKVSGLMPTGTTGSRVVSLYQGATLIKTWSTITLTSVNVETSLTLTGVEAATITASGGTWSNLSIKVTDTAS